MTEFETKSYLGGIVSVAHETPASRDGRITQFTREHQEAGEVWASTNSADDDLNRDALMQHRVRLRTHPLGRRVTFLGYEILIGYREPPVEESRTSDWMRRKQELTDLITEKRLALPASPITTQKEWADFYIMRRQELPEIKVEEPKKPSVPGEPRWWLEVLDIIKSQEEALAAAL